MSFSPLFFLAQKNWQSASSCKTWDWHLRKPTVSLLRRSKKIKFSFFFPFCRYVKTRETKGGEEGTVWVGKGLTTFFCRRPRWKSGFFTLFFDEKKGKSSFVCSESFFPVGDQEGVAASAVPTCNTLCKHLIIWRPPIYKVRKKFKYFPLFFPTPPEYEGKLE